MLYVCFYLLVLLDVYEAEAKFNYKIEYKKDYSPGHVCNYETWHLTSIQYVLYTCVPAEKCMKGHGLYKKRPELHYDNCPYIFLVPPGGGTYTCCHPQDFEDTIKNPNATLAPLQIRFMSGFRSGFKCNEYAKFVCLNDTFCPEELQRERKGHTATSIAKYPHVAVVGWMDEHTEDQSWFCLGSVVSERFVLTAATCREDKDGHFASRIRVGEDALCDISVNCDYNEYAQLLIVEKQIHHPKSYLAYFYHDLMLLKTTTEILFTGQVRPACLYREMHGTLGGGQFPLYEDPAEGENQQFQTIHEMNLQTWSNRYCRERYVGDPRLVDSVVDDDSMFCAGLPGGVPLPGPSQPCKFDYGGGIVDQNPDGSRPRCMWEIYGVMSWAQEFICGATKPPIFTRTSFYLEWIEDTLWPSFDILKEYRTLPPQCDKPVALALNAQPSGGGRCSDPRRPSF